MEARPGTDGSGWALREGDEAIVTSLCDRSGRDVQNILVAAFDRRVHALRAADLVRRHGESGVTHPSPVGQGDRIRFEAMAVSHLPRGGGDLVDLAPVTPLGATSTLTSLSHKTVLSTIRGTEVVADAIIPLTLELAARRAALGSSWEGATVGSFHRELRMQRFSRPEFTPHFHALSLVSAAVTTDYEGFVHRTLVDHVNTYLRILEGSLDLGYTVGRVQVRVSNLRILELLLRSRGRDRNALPRRAAARDLDVLGMLDIDLPPSAGRGQLAALVTSTAADCHRVRKPLGSLLRLTEAIVAGVEPRALPVDVVADLGRHAGLGYYQDLCVKIAATTVDGRRLDLVDIGSNAWMSALTGSRKERLVTGGMGTETFMRYFRRPPHEP